MPALARVVVLAAVAALAGTAVALAEVLAAVEADVLARHVLLVLGVAEARVPPAPDAVRALTLGPADAVLDAQVALGADAGAVGRAELAGRALGAVARLLALIAGGARSAQALLFAAVNGLVAVLADQGQLVKLLLGTCACACAGGRLGRKDGRKEGGTHFGRKGWVG